MAGPVGRAIAAAALIAACIGLLHLVEPLGDTRIHNELRNAGHALVFAAVALLALFGLRALGAGRAAAYGGALAVALGLGAVSEYLQIGNPLRDASVGDWWRDAAGAVAALIAVAFWRRDVVRWPVGTLLLALAAASLAAVAAPVAIVWGDYRGRDAAFPVLCCLTGPWEARFLRANSARIEPAPDGPAGPGFMRLQLMPAKWPGFSVQEVHPDWSGYEALALDVYAERPVPVRLVVRVDDLAHDGTNRRDRFSRRFEIEPGLNRIRIPIADILAAPAGRSMDVRRMKKIIVFAERPTAPFSVYLSDLRLVRDGAQSAD